MTEEYKGTIDSKFGKICVTKQTGKTGDYMQLLSEGPEDKGFAGLKEALDEVKKLAEEEWEYLNAKAEEEAAETPEPIELSTYYVIRVAQTVKPRPQTRVELDMGI